MKKSLITLVLLLIGLLVAAGCSSSTPPEKSVVAESPAKENAGEDTTAAETTAKKEARIPLVVSEVQVVEVTNNGFTPRELTVNAGDYIQFVAKDGGRHWPATNVHPMHEAYPGSSIGKCNGPEQDTVFDACRVLSQDQMFEFRFTKEGRWNYHDHLHPALTGTITVEAKE